MKRVAAVVAVASLWSSVSLLMAPAVADAPDATGWWARWAVATPATPTTAGPVPVPPPSQPEQARLVPPGGLYVAAEPTSETQPPPPPGGGVKPPSTPYRPTGVSAVRLAVDDTMALGELVLAIDVHPQSGQRKVQGTPAIRACPAQYVWTPEEGGHIDSAPRADCASGLSFAAITETEVRIPVGGLVRDGMLNIVLEPLPTSAFQVVFKKPTDQSIAVTRFPQADDVPDGFEDYVGFDSGPAFETISGTSGSSAFGDLSLPLPTNLTPTGPPAAGPSRAVPASSFPSARRLPLASRTPRVVAAMVMVGLILIYLGLLQQPGRLPRLLGPFASALPGRPDTERPPPTPPAEWPQGIGRFARVRTGPPPKL